MVYAKIFNIKADILTNTHILTTFFRKNGFNGEITGGRHCYIENCISTRSTKKMFMGVSLNYVLDLIFGKIMKNIPYLDTF